ncbi:hypothetical protein LUZ63_015314 [Rhynchospora breviuscula]|uniref:cytokinin dehydrogenase n=1 Tax=Rhynchospora breviuscula TaxID=2022672 RepID=A0A9Q0CCQ8_9POAL|nr:hypothetical protein LUZ63_015314 [Rhynchospora breviuscula]
MDLSRQNSIILSITILTTFASFVKSSLPQGLQTLNISSEITTDPNITASFATDFGNLFNCTPGAVFFPSSPKDIATLIRFSYTSTTPFHISQRGLGHSAYGQTLVPDGILIDMSSLDRTNYNRINVTSNGPIPYADVGAEQIWIDVLNATLKHDLMPRLLTDYLSLTVGGTLSNAGLSGRAFMHGPQISNVYELDVITGTGEIVTCSKESNPDLFYAVLGGLGQFGVITRARIALEPAQKRVRWLELFYTDIKVLTSDEEKLISTGNSLSGIVDYLEGEVLFNVTQGLLTGSFNFSNSDVEKIVKLASENSGPIYLLNVVLFYNDTTATSVDQKVELLLKELHYTSGFAFSYDLPLFNFLNRLSFRVAATSSVAQCPWLVMLVPKSKVLEFGSKVYRGILNGFKGGRFFLLYPLNRAMWDDEMSAVTPNEEVFYRADFLWTSEAANETKSIAKKNKQIQNICEKYNFGCKEYLPHFTNQIAWQKQFGEKWEKFVSRKMKYDPKALLSPGQRIFTTLGIN